MSKFNREHHEDIAAVIHDLHELYDGLPQGDAPVGAHLVLYRVTEKLGEMFTQDNSKFNMQKFEDACLMGQKFADEPD